MENTPHLYDTLVLVLCQHATWVDQRHLKTLAWMMVGLIHSGWINLTAWAPYVVSRAQYAQSTVRRFRRWLDNDKIDALALYGPLIEQALVPWGEQGLYVALDTSMLWNTYCLIRLSVIYRGRAVPLVWCVLHHGSAQVAFKVYQDLLERAALLVPRRCTVILLADRGFADTDQEELLALSLRASALQSRAPRRGPGARLFLAAGVHHQKALWSSTSRRGP